MSVLNPEPTAEVVAADLAPPPEPAPPQFEFADAL